MKKKLSLIPALLLMLFSASLMGGMLVSCSGSEADAKVDTFVGQLNSDTFKEQTVKSGIFTGAEAKVEDDAVVLTFQTIPGLSFKNATQALMDVQKEAMLGQFKQALPADKVFREGFEGMRDKSMTFRMVFLDTNGDTASIDILPSEVLD
ncbi:MAG: hypothetical protein K2L39_05585 [Muribaculaceae bacterium]|nr:hypothetical protein [Muribaculaceae bacterium]